VSLEKAFHQLKKYEEKLQKYKKLPTVDKREEYKKYFQYHEIVFQKNIVQEMLERRKEKYSIPVE
jgi:hypothetical protein